MNKPLILEYRQPAPEAAEFAHSCSDDKEPSGWEQWSLPLGNSHFGACIFGRTERDRIQITENSLSNPLIRGKNWAQGHGGTRSFGDLIFDFGHKKISRYRRYLSLDDAVAGVSYECGGVVYKREYFLSYPDNVLVMRFTANRGNRISFSVTPLISFCGNYCVSDLDGCGRTGEVISGHSDLVMRGVSNYYNIKYEGRARVKAYGGKTVNENGVLTVKNAEVVEIYFTCATNYVMESRVFEELEPKEKLAPYEDPGYNVTKTLNAACAKGYDKLKRAHIEDYTKLFGRVAFSLGGRYHGLVLENGEYKGTSTPELLNIYKEYARTVLPDNDIRYDLWYLEELMFQYGRYLLISSSRTKGYPANRQGTWCAYDSSPWGCDYNHSMCVQMNYWHADVTNLPECFTPYLKYVKAYMPAARKNADKYILQNFPDQYSGRGTNGWTVSSSATLYSVSESQVKGQHGPGAGAFTSLLLWQHYDFIRDKNYLRETAYPYLLEMSRFFLKTLIKSDDKYLAGVSSSFEPGKNGIYYVTVGCAFDQQMIYENFDKTLQAARILGITEEDEPLLEQIEKILPLLDPVITGNLNQIKEYREDTSVSLANERSHVHNANLVGLYPGDMISKKTPEWVESAKITLIKRSDGSIGSARAHRLCLWARTGEGERAYSAYASFIKSNALTNLWAARPPFQIDGNFGITAGVCEMLMQSHTGVIELLPAIPGDWRNGSFVGLCARGNFTIGCVWENMMPRTITVTAGSGGMCRLRFQGAQKAFLDNKEFSVDDDLMFFPMLKGETVHISVKQ